MQQSEFDEEVAEFEIRLERLRALYEQYFLGIERIEPTVARKDVDRRAWRLKKVKPRNTAKRFKLQTLFQRYNTLQQYWIKVCRQIENGTYTRHLARAERRFGADARRARKSLPPEPAPELDHQRAVDQASEQLSAMLTQTGPGDEPAAAPAAAPERPESPTAADPRRGPPPRRQRPEAGELSDGRVKQLYGSLRSEQQRLNQSSSLSEAALAKTLRATEARLRKKYAGKRIDFQVGVRDGKAVIKPIVR